MKASKKEKGRRALLSRKKKSGRSRFKNNSCRLEEESCSKIRPEEIKTDMLGGNKKGTRNGRSISP